MTKKKKKITRRPSLNFDQAEFKRWTALCWLDREGEVVVQCVLGNEKQHHAATTLRWPSDSAAIKKFIVSHVGCGRVHATPVQREPGHPTPRENAACLDGYVCWADIDIDLSVDEIQQRLGPLPAAIVATGGPGRHHVYVPLDMPYQPDDIKRGNEALRELLEADAAQSPSHLLSIPGTFNHKYRQGDGPPRVTFVVEPGDDEYVSVDDIVAHVGAHTRRPPSGGGAFVSPTGLGALPHWLLDVLTKPAGPKRGGQAYHAVMCLMEYGLHDYEVRHYAEHVPAIEEKFDGRVDQQIDTLITKGRKLHGHAGLSCAQARCPNQPNWMSSAPPSVQYLPPTTFGDFVSQDIQSEWLIEGLVTHPTSGMIAGPAKSFKSWLGLELSMSVATGTDFLGRFRVNKTGAVLIYLNEGSIGTHIERLRRLQRAHDVEGDDIPIHLRTNTVSCDSAQFLRTLERDLALLKPVLVILDPWYAFHGTQADVTNLMSEGALLRRVEGPCIDAGATLLIANHFAKSAKELRLSAITQSGAAEWCDSWILAKAINVAGADASLELRLGGRASGGEKKYVVRACGGMLAGIEQPFTWEVRTPTDSYRGEILRVLGEVPEGLGKAALRKAVTGSNVKIDAAVEELLEEEIIIQTDGQKFALST